MKAPWLVLLMLCSPPVFAQKAEFVDASGNAFTRLCSVVDKENRSSEESMHLGACIGYVEGLLAGIRFGTDYAVDVSGKKVPPMLCYPDSLENGQIIRILLKYIRDNPEEAHVRTPVLLVQSLQAAYPCPKR